MVYRLPFTTIPALDDTEVEHCLSFAQSEFAKRIMTHAAQNWAMDNLEAKVDHTGKAKVDITDIRYMPEHLSPGLAIRLGIKLIMAAVNAVDTNASKLIDSLANNEEKT